LEPKKAYHSGIVHKSHNRIHSNISGDLGVDQPRETGRLGSDERRGWKINVPNIAFDKRSKIAFRECKTIPYSALVFDVEWALAPLLCRERRSWL
jgi:hypothetical protein